MIFCVNVPVLSLKIYSTCPSSSVKLEDWTLMYIFLASSNIFASQYMKIAWKNLINSSVTSSEIGTKSQNINHQDPSPTRKVRIVLVSVSWLLIDHAKYDSVSSLLFRPHVVLYNDAKIQSEI